MIRGRARGPLVALGVFLALAASTPAAGQEDGLNEARRAYEAGTKHYSLGEYDEAVALFRQAYDLSAAPGLLFNIAQAQRLAGRCAPALEAYKHFVRLDPTSAYRGEAEMQIAHLTPRCGPELAAADRANSPSAPLKAPGAEAGDVAKPAAVRTPARTRLAIVLLGAGAAAGLLAGGLALWNNDRWSHWTAEDHFLETVGPGAEMPSSLIDRQNANDSRLRSIRSFDRAVVALTSLSLTTMAGAAVVMLLPVPTPSAGPQLGGVQVTWSGRWP